MTLGAGGEGAGSCAVLIYAMLCRAIERLHRWRVWDETARRLWFCIGVRRPLGWISYISHTGSCPLCHKTNKHAATRNERSASGTKGGNRMYFGDNSVEPIAHWHWYSFIAVLPHPRWRVIPPMHKHSFRQPLSSHSHPADLNLVWCLQDTSQIKTIRQ